MRPGSTVEEIKRNIELSKIEASKEAEVRKLRTSSRALCAYVGIEYVGP